MNTTPQHPGPVPGPNPANPFAGPATPHPGVAGPVAPYAMMPRKAPWWQREGVVSKLLVLTGGAITLIGVVMLLVIAAQAGLLSPHLRVAGGALLSAGLIAAGMRIHNRPGGSIGAVALAGTGIAGLFIVTVAMSSFYEWVPGLGGLALAGAIAAAAGALAVQWRTELLAICVTVAVAALAPVLTSGVTVSLVWFMVILQAAGLVPERVRDWHYLGFVRTLPAVFVVIAYAAQVRSVESLPAVLTVLGLSAASLIVSRGTDDELHSGAFVVGALPVAVQLSYLDRPVAVIAGGAVAIALAAIAGLMPSLGAFRRVTLGGVAICVGMEACFTFTHGSWLPVLLLVPGLFVTAAAASLRSLLLTLAGLVLGVVGGAAYLGFADPASLASSGLADAHLSYATMLGGLLLAAWAGAAGLALVRSGLKVPPTVAAVAAGVVGLYGATAAIISFGSSVGATEGFHSAHLGVTVVWVSAAMSLMAFGLCFPRYAASSLAGGLLLAGCAIGKLVLFDLQEMSGATRAVTFIVVGLVLLFAGSRYAQAFARVRGEARQNQRPMGPVVQH